MPNVDLELDSGDWAQLVDALSGCFAGQANRLTNVSRLSDAVLAKQLNTVVNTDASFSSLSKLN